MFSSASPVVIVSRSSLARSRSAGHLECLVQGAVVLAVVVGAAAPVEAAAPVGAAVAVVAAVAAVVAVVAAPVLRRLHPRVAVWVGEWAQMGRGLDLLSQWRPPACPGGSSSHPSKCVAPFHSWMCGL